MARSDEGGYRVGYGKPPREHRFRKGTSGNPAGRPRGAKNIVLKRSLNPYLDAFLRETDRIVPLRDGGQLVELSVFEAAVRKLGVKAINGDLRALKLLIEERKLAEQAHLEDMASQIQVVERYKAEWGPRFEEARKKGLPEPKQLPHPDHVDICRTTGLIKFTGPDVPELKEIWDSVKQVLRLIERRLLDARAAAAAAPRSKKKAEDVKTFEKMFRKIHKEQVPLGWNWREEIGDCTPKI